MDKVRLAVDVGALTRNHAPLVAAQLPDLTAGTLTKRQLAQFSPQELTTFADPYQALNGPSPAGLPAHQLDGLPDDGSLPTATDNRANVTPASRCHGGMTLASRRGPAAVGTGRPQPRIRPEVGTPVPAVTSTCSTSGTGLTDVPRS